MNVLDREGYVYKATCCGGVGGGGGGGAGSTPIFEGSMKIPPDLPPFLALFDPICSLFFKPSLSLILFIDSLFLQVKLVCLYHV